MDSVINSFWNWFKINNLNFSQIDNIKDEALKEQLLDGLLEKLHSYCDKLYFELGGTIDGSPSELIITAEGDPDYFEKADTLVKFAPVIDNWIFISLIPRRDINFEIEFEGIKIKPENIWFMPLDNSKFPKSIGIRIGVENYEEFKDKKWFQSTILKIIDTVIGEKSFAIDIQHIDFGEITENPKEAGFIKIEELADFLDWKKKRIGKI